jgi:hypothetical protein
MRLRAKTLAIAAASIKDGETDDATSAKDKAQARRAQVRKAQIQHRERKANYTKQLELDVVRYRDMISQTERETGALRRDNAAMRVKLQSHLAKQSMSTSLQQPTQQLPLPQVPVHLPQVPVPEPIVSLDLVGFASSALPPATTELFGDLDVAQMTVTLAMDEMLGTPCYHISSSTSGSSVHSPVSPDHAMGEDFPLPLSPEQEELAINFVLSYVRVLASSEFLLTWLTKIIKPGSNTSAGITSGATTSPRTATTRTARRATR